MECDGFDTTKCVLAGKWLTVRGSDGWTAASVFSLKFHTFGAAIGSEVGSTGFVTIGAKRGCRV